MKSAFTRAFVSSKTSATRLAVQPQFAPLAKESKRSFFVIENYRLLPLDQNKRELEREKFNSDEINQKYVQKILKNKKNQTSALSTYNVQLNTVSIADKPNLELLKAFVNKNRFGVSLQVEQQQQLSASEILISVPPAGHKEDSTNNILIDEKADLATSVLPEMKKNTTTEES